MLHKHLARVLRLELPDPAWVPQLARNAQILAAAHQRVGATSLRCGGDAVGGKVVLFTAGDGNEPLI